jgi:hypothetical protein
MAIVDQKWSAFPVLGAINLNPLERPVVDLGF